MAFFLAAVVEGLGQCVETFWWRQERRFGAVLGVVSSAATAMTMALAFCFLSIDHRYIPRQFPVPFM
ncbi:hypothetical protein U1Q18_039120 [Sarracenia purpurea var. burkii]